MLECRLCGRKFNSPLMLSEHLRTHGKILCRYGMCHFYANDLPDLDRHLRNVHGKVATYECVICQKYFDTPQEASDHVNK